MIDDETSQGGFTIIETLIVVAVSGILLLSAVVLVAGQQRKVEFTQAIQDFRSAIEQVISETASGYYPDTRNMSCVVAGSDIVINSGASNDFGANTGCIFLGKAVQFAVQGTDPQAYYVHTVAGKQENTGTLVSATPKPVNRGDVLQKLQVNNGVRVTAMRYKIGAARTDVGAVAFLNGLGTYGADGLESGTPEMMLVPINNSGNVTTGTDQSAVETAIDDSLETSPINPDGGVELCLAGGPNQWALVTIGSNNRKLSVTLDRKSADCSI